MTSVGVPGGRPSPTGNGVSMRPGPKIDQSLKMPPGPLRIEGECTDHLLRLMPRLPPTPLKSGSVAPYPPP